MLVNQNVMIQQVSKLLGHTSIEMTSDHYADIETKGLHDQVNVIGKIDIK
jgi:integrase